MTTQTVVVRRTQRAVERMPRMLFLECGHPIKVTGGTYAGCRGVVMARTQELDPLYRVLLDGRQRLLWFYRSEISYSRIGRETR